MGMSSPDVVVVSVELEYKSPINWGNDVTVDLDVGDIGDRSFSLEYEIRTEKEVAATAQTTQVTIDPGNEDSRPIPERYEKAFGAST
jgi:acyl-CoA thioester hydrolase